MFQAKLRDVSKCKSNPQKCRDFSSRALIETCIISRWLTSWSPLAKRQRAASRECCTCALRTKKSRHFEQLKHREFLDKCKWWSKKHRDFKNREVSNVNAAIVCSQSLVAFTLVWKLRDFSNIATFGCKLLSN